MTRLPILYSFRRCPYAIRARMVMLYAGYCVELREIVFRHKPAAMLEASAKGTVPVLVLPDGQVIDESLDVMLHVLRWSDPDNLLGNAAMQAAQLDEVLTNDLDFKHWLDRYKYHDRYPKCSREYYRERGEWFLHRLEQRLCNSDHLFGPKPMLADVALVPFVRQFAHVDKAWFESNEALPNLQQWLNHWLNRDLFTQSMHKNEVWSGEGEGVVFPPPDIQAFIPYRSR